MKRFFCTSNNSYTIEEVLQKHRKVLDREALSQIQSFYKTHKLNHIPLWRMGGFMRVFSQFARLQVYAYGICSIGYLIYAIKTKWHKGQDVQRRIKFLAPIVIVSSLAALKISTYLSRLLIKEINYYPELEQFGVTYYTNLFTTKKHMVKPQHIKPLEVKSRWQASNYMVEINGKDRPSSTQVLGDWYNKRLFYHLIDGKRLQDEPAGSYERMQRAKPKQKKTTKK